MIELAEKWVAKKLPESENFIFTRSIQNKFSKLQREFVLALVDKAPSTFNLVCKKHAYHKMQEYLDKAIKKKRFEHIASLDSDATRTKIIETHIKFLKKENIFIPDYLKKPKETKLPKLSMNVKLHKIHNDPESPYNGQPKIGYRFITAAHDNFSTPIAKTITTIWKALWPQIDHLWEKRLNRYNIRGNGRCFLVNSALEVKERVQTLNTRKRSNYKNVQNFSKTHVSRPKLTTWDFRSFYPSLNVDDLLSKTRTYSKILFASKKRKVLVVDTKCFTFRWVLTKSPKLNSTEKIIDYEILNYYMDVLFDNLYVTHGDQIYKQLQGIPQGASPCVYLANFYLWCYEYEWLERILIHKRMDLVPLIWSMTRLIDDILVLDHDFTFPTIEEHDVIGTYPAYLGLDREQCSDDRPKDKFAFSVNYLNLTISSYKRYKPEYFMLQTKAFDKSLDPNYGSQLFPLVRKYPNPKSRISDSTHKNALTELFISNIKLNTRFYTVPFTLASICTRYLQNGWKWNPIKERLHLAYFKLSPTFRAWGKDFTTLVHLVKHHITRLINTHDIYKPLRKTPIFTLQHDTNDTEMTDLTKTCMRWCNSLMLYPNKRLKSQTLGTIPIGPVRNPNDPLAPLSASFARSRGMHRADRELMGWKDW